MTHLPHACCLLHVAITAVKEVVLEMIPWEMSYARHNLKIGILFSFIFYVLLVTSPISLLAFRSLISFTSMESGWYRDIPGNREWEQP